MNGIRDDIRLRLKELQFALWETALYLDVYPQDKDAMEYFSQLHSATDAAKAEYEKQYGPLSRLSPLQAKNWTAGPWPWESEAN